MEPHYWYHGAYGAYHFPVAPENLFVAQGNAFLRCPTQRESYDTDYPKIVKRKVCWQGLKNQLSFSYSVTRMI